MSLWGPSDPRLPRGKNAWVDLAPGRVSSCLLPFLGIREHVQSHLHSRHLAQLLNIVETCVCVFQMAKEEKKKKSKPSSLLYAKLVDPRGCKLPLNICHGSHSALCSPAESPAVKRKAVSGLCWSPGAVFAISVQGRASQTLPCGQSQNVVDLSTLLSQRCAC